MQLKLPLQPLYKWFFIEYWIKTGLDFYPGPFFIFILSIPFNTSVD